MIARHIRHTSADGTPANQTVPDTVEREGEVPPATLAGLSRFHAITHYISRRDGRRRTNVRRRVLGGTVMVVIALAALTTAYLTHVSRSLTATIDDGLTEALATRGSGEPYYLLIVGVDRKDGDDEAYEHAGKRAEVIIVARIDDRDRLVTLVSVPPDTLMFDGSPDLLGIGNTYAVGGAGTIAHAVNELTGLDLTHYAEIELGDFAALIDDVGGIDLTLPVAVSDLGFTGLELPRGQVHLDGYDALMFIRCVRAYDSYGDASRYRSANQRSTLTALSRILCERSLLSLPGTVATLSERINTDMGALTTFDLLVRLHGIDVEEKVLSGQIPTVDVFVDGGWYKQIDTEAWNHMRDRIDAGLPPYEHATDDPTRGVAASAAMRDGESDGPVVEPVYEGTVSVLNATDVEGLAATATDALNARGFEASAANATSHAETSHVWYNGDDALAKATAVIDVLGIDDTPVANDGTLPADANVIVVLGSDAI